MHRIVLACVVGALAVVIAAPLAGADTPAKNAPSAASTARADTPAKEAPPASTARADTPAKKAPKALPADGLTLKMERSGFSLRLPRGWTNASTPDTDGVCGPRYTPNVHFEYVRKGPKATCKAILDDFRHEKFRDDIRPDFLPATFASPAFVLEDSMGRRVRTCVEGKRGAMRVWIDARPEADLRGAVTVLESLAKIVGAKRK